MSTLELLFYLTVFVAAMFMFDLVMNFASSLRASRTLAANLRARMLAEGATSTEVLSRLTNRDVGEADRAGWITKRMRGLEATMLRAGLRMGSTRFLIFSAVAGGVLTVLFLTAFRFPPASALIFGFAIAGIAATIFLINRINTRQMRMTEQLPEAIDMIVRSLQAGHPIRTALGLVAQDLDDPLGTEIGIAVDEMTFGLELEAALGNLRERVRVGDLDYMVVAINIHSRTGGNLAEILSNLSETIRDRYRVLKKVKALSAEGRLSASIIALVPFIIGIILGLNVPNYYSDAMKNASFPIIAGIAAVLYGVSLFAIWRIVKIKV